MSRRRVNTTPIKPEHYFITYSTSFTISTMHLRPTTLTRRHSRLRTDKLFLPSWNASATIQAKLFDSPSEKAIESSGSHLRLPEYLTLCMTVQAMSAHPVALAHERIGSSDSRLHRLGGSAASDAITMTSPIATRSWGGGIVWRL
jgi:hypothetical protein